MCCLRECYSASIFLLTGALLSQYILLFTRMLQSHVAVPVYLSFTRVKKSEYILHKCYISVCLLFSSQQCYSLVYLSFTRVLESQYILHKCSPVMFAVQFTKALQFDVFVIHKSDRVPVSSICCSHDCLLDCYSPTFFAVFSFFVHKCYSPVYLLLTKVFQCSALFYCLQDCYCPSVNVLLKMAWQPHLLCCSLDLYCSSFFTGAGR